MIKRFKVSKIFKSLLVAVLLICLVTMSIPVSFANTTLSVDSIYIKDVAIIQNTNGYNSGYYDDNNIYNEFYYYYYSPESIITLDDGSEITCRGSIFDYNGEDFFIDFYDDQSYENPWEIGEHNVTASFMGVETSFTVTIVESPIQSIAVDDFEIIEGTYVYYESDSYGNEYKNYYYNPDVTVTLTDGSVITCEYGEFVYNGEFFYADFTDDQSYENQWGIGTHKATASLLGAKCTFNVTITESPVQSIAVDNIEIVEGTNLQDACYEDDIVYWYKYYDYSPDVTVTLKDGSEILCENRAFEYNGETYYIYINDDQSYDNQWEVGEHNVTASLMGAETSFTVTITESPIQSIAVDNVEIIEGTDFYYEFDDYDNEYKEYYYSPDFTVTLKNGSVITGVNGEFEYNGEYYYPEFYDDQSYDNQWGLGDHTGTVSLMGVESTFTVTITETPIQSIAINNVEIIEGTNFYYEFDDYDNEYKEYYYSPDFTVTLKDGSVITGENGDLEYNGECYSMNFTDDQSYENQWGVGKHNVTASLMGVESTFTVTITETPIKSIDVPDVYIIENANCSDYYDYNDNIYTHYFYEVPEFTVTYTNGDVVTYTDTDEIEYDGSYYNVNFYDEQEEEKWCLGKHSAKISFLGFESNFNVNIIETPVSKVTFSDANLIENANCYTEIDDEDREYNEYYYSPGKCTITMKDNTIITDCDEFEYMGQIYYPEIVEDDQSADNQWELGGTYNSTATMMGLEGDCKVHIVENPVVSLHIDDIIVDKDINPIRFNIFEHMNFELTLNDGTVLTELSDTYYGYFIEYDGQKYRFDLEGESFEGTSMMLINASVMGAETTFKLTYEGEQTTALYGDVDGDGQVTIMDTTMIQKHYVGLDTIPSSKISIADVDSNGEITVVDATEIQKYLAGINTYDIIGQPCIL